MYLTSRAGAGTEAHARAGPIPRGGRHRWVAGNVVALGAVSLVTDISSEMVTAVLPLYLVVGLGLSPLQFGFLDGLYSGVTAMLRLVGGHVGDRWRRRKVVAGVGYALSAGSRLVLLAAGGSVPALGAGLAIDRAGKGLRTAPRDALITASSPPGQLGRAFGVHRAMDTTGALLGPLAAVGLLWVTAGAFDAIFVVSLCVGLLGLVLLVLFVREPRAVPEVPRGAGPSIRAAAALLRRGPFRRLCAVAVILGVTSIGDAFLYLLLRQQFDLPAQYFPLLPLGTAASYLVLAIPLGRLADRVGRRRVFLAGHLALLAAYAVLVGAGGLVGSPRHTDAGALAAGLAAVAGVLCLHGVFYAATDGVLMACAGPVLPVQSCASGIALLQSAQAVARLCASIVFGAAWTVWGGPLALAVAMGALVLAIAVAGSLLRDRSVPPGPPAPPGHPVPPAAAGHTSAHAGASA